MNKNNRFITICEPSSERTVSIDGEPILLDALRAAGIVLSAPCSGEGSCGRCRIKVRGQVSAMSAEELAFEGIGESDTDGFVTRLACMTRIAGSCEVKLQKGAALHKLTALSMDACSSFDEPFGVAVDLGTTTIGMRAVRMSDGQTLAQACELNDQRTCGADVMTRIAYCSKESGLDTLHRLIASQLTRMLLKLMGGRLPEQIAVAGNTVMLHLLAGISPEHLGRAPYRTDEYFGREFSAEELGLPCNAWLLPCVGGFAGGDLVAAILALTDPSCGGEAERDGLAICDLGTNGEMALYSNGSWTAASAAAGPALEGGGISCGSGAIDGAVTRIKYSEHHTHKLTSDSGEGIPVECQVIGEGRPETLTGAALISLTALLLRQGRLEPNGRMPEECWLLEGKVSYTQADVRQLQLAKGAVAAALLRLQENVITADKKNNCLHIDLNITGGLGCELEPDDAECIGLIPCIDGADMSVRFIANLALEGSALCLSQSGRDRASDIASRTTVLELTGDGRFDELFVGCLRLGAPEEQ